MEIGAQYIAYMFLAAFGGGLVDGLYGFAKALKKGEKFNTGKFAGTFMVAVVTGGAFVGAYAWGDRNPTWAEYVAAFGAGAGVDNLTNKVVAVRLGILDIFESIFKGSDTA